MGGVDKCDQYLSYYTVSRRSMKLWKKVFFQLLELCIINSMCIYFRKNPDFVKKWNSHKKYQEDLVHILVQPYLGKKAAECTEPRRIPQNTDKTLSRITVNDTVGLSGKYYPVRSENRRKCCNCAYKVIAISGKRIDKKTNDYYPKCPKHLCKLCFKGFHSLSKL